MSVADECPTRWTRKVTRSMCFFFQVNNTDRHWIFCFFLRPGLSQEGLFRRNGKIKQQHELMKEIKGRSAADVDRLLDSGAYTVHEVATVLKNLLADMPEPLLVEAFYPLHCHLASPFPKVSFFSASHLLLRLSVAGFPVRETTRTGWMTSRCCC